MKLLSKFSLKSFFTPALTAILFFTITWKTSACDASYKDFCSLLTLLQDTSRPKAPLNQPVGIIPDTVPSAGDTIPYVISDSIQVQKVDTFNLRISKDTLSGPVHYEASDSAVVFVQEKKIILYGSTRTEYQDVILTAPMVLIDEASSTLTAIARFDSSGYAIERAVFTQGENNFQSDTITYNFKTQKGLTINTYTQQGEFFVYGEDIKKINETTSFAQRARFTTCNLEEPHFAFRAKRMKVISEKVAVTGPVGVEFEGVPMPPPLGLPFSFYPLSRGRHSGFLPPQFTTNEDFGIGLEGLGYYQVLNDYLDVTTRANIYSYGGWMLNITPTYRKRYRYNGALNLSINSTKFNFKGDPDYQKTRSYFITWSHNVDSRARPGTSFSASVGAGSTRYNELLPNNPGRNFQNQLSSSISYGKTWAGKPYSLSVSANHSQNNQLRLINVGLPDVGFTVSTIYPFQPKEMVGAPKWYEKLGLAYNGSFRNQFSFYDTAFSFRQLIDTLQWGAQHNVPITLSLPQMGPLMVAPSISYRENWIAQKFRRSWNDAEQKIDTSITKGFFTDRSVQFGLSFNTAVFGTYEFKKSRVVAIRHTMRPSLSLNYKPDLSRQHFYTTRINSRGDSLRFSEYDGSLYGFFQEGVFGGLGFVLDNNLEMKWRSRTDTGENAIKKIRLIDGYGLTTGYNFVADSFRLSPIQFYLRSTLFEKINITASATLDPYQFNENGYPVDRFAWQGQRFSLGRIRTGNIAISTRFQSKPKDPEEEERRQQEAEDRLGDPALIGDQQRLMDYMQRNPGEFVNFNIPWSFGFSFSLYFIERLKSDYSGFEKQFSSNINFNGSVNLTEKWNLSSTGYFDFNTKKLQMFSLSVSRDMHCWQMSIGVTPVGLYRFFNITISPKSAILQDLRINRTRTFNNF